MSAGQGRRKARRPVFSRRAARPSGASPPAPAPTHTEAPTPEQVEAIAHVQSCLAELGYYKGAIDGKRGRETWTAYWNFKHDHGLGGYSDLLAEPVRQKLDSLCHRDDRGARAAAQPADQPELEAAPDCWRPAA